MIHVPAVGTVSRVMDDAGVWRDVLAMGSPSDIVTPGYMFDDAELAPQEQRVFETAIRLACVMLSGYSGLMYTSVRADQLFRSMEQYLADGGWQVGTDKTARWLAEARASRMTLHADMRAYRWWDVHDESQAEQLNARRVLAGADFRPPQPHSVGEAFSEGVFDTASGGQSAIHVSIRRDGSTCTTRILVLFDEAFAKPSRRFFQSQYLWSRHPLNYCARYGWYRDRSGSIVIDRPIEGRDGEGIHVDCFDAGTAILAAAAKWNIPISPTQMFLEHVQRYV